MLALFRCASGLSSSFAFQVRRSVETQLEDIELDTQRLESMYDQLVDQVSAASWASGISTRTSQSTNLLQGIFHFNYVINIYSVLVWANTGAGSLSAVFRSWVVFSAVFIHPESRSEVAEVEEEAPETAETEMKSLLVCYFPREANKEMIRNASAHSVGRRVFGVFVHSVVRSVRWSVIPYMSN